MIRLFTYQDAFDENKYRPGFRVNGTLYVLSTRKPRSHKQFIELPVGTCTNHFATGKKTYLVKATNQGAVRYNNISGGHLVISSNKMLEIFNEDITDYELIKTNSYMKVSQFAVINGIITVTDPASFTKEQLGLPFPLNIPDPATGSLVPTEDVAKIHAIVLEWAKEALEGTAEANAKAWAAKHENACFALFAEAAAEELLTVIAADAETISGLLADLTASEPTVREFVESCVTAFGESSDEEKEAAAAAIAQFLGADLKEAEVASAEEVAAALAKAQGDQVQAQAPTAPAAEVPAPTADTQAAPVDVPVAPVAPVDAPAAVVDAPAKVMNSAPISVNTKATYMASTSRRIELIQTRFMEDMDLIKQDLAALAEVPATEAPKAEDAQLVD